MVVRVGWSTSTAWCPPSKLRFVSVLSSAPGTAAVTAAVTTRAATMGTYAGASTSPAVGQSVPGGRDPSGVSELPQAAQAGCSVSWQTGGCNTARAPQPGSCIVCRTQRSRRTHLARAAPAPVRSCCSARRGGQTAEERSMYGGRQLGQQWSALQPAFCGDCGDDLAKSELAALWVRVGVGSVAGVWVVSGECGEHARGMHCCPYRAAIE